MTIRRFAVVLAGAAIAVASFAAPASAASRKAPRAEPVAVVASGLRVPSDWDPEADPSTLPRVSQDR